MCNVNVSVCKITLGGRVFIKELGKVATVTSLGLDGKITVILNNTNDVITQLPIQQVEPYCGDVYEIGSSVQSVLGGGFVGRVVGYEYETNRVICISNKVRPDSDNRTRYAYKLEELRKYEEEFTFELNRKYRVNGGVVIRAIEHPESADKFYLVRDDSGKIVLTTPKTVTKQLLNVNGLLNITVM